MKKKFPVICPDGSHVVITQGFFYPDKNPATGQTHDAVDFIIQNPKLTDRENERLTYGAQLVAPIAGNIVEKFDEGTMNNLGNGIDLEWFEDGFWWRLHYWHTVFELMKVGDPAKEGDIVALMGNTGDCRPLPTPQAPYQGTHCHLVFSRYKKLPNGGNVEIVSLDPRDYFDIETWYTGKDSSVTIDLEPVKWAWSKLSITTIFGKLMYLLTNIFN